MTAIWWIRRDLRLSDNPALAAALNHADLVVPVFILDSFFKQSPYVGEKRVAFMLGGLRAFDADLRRIGGPLIVRRGDPIEVLAGLIKECGADAIFAERDTSPYARSRDDRVARELPLTLVEGLTVRPVELIEKKDGTPYTVYTPFSRAWKVFPPPQRGDLIPPPGTINTPDDIISDPLPDQPLPANIPFPPGEAEAQRRLEAFRMGDDPPVYRYDELRNRVDVDGTSRLSPYLRWGMISAQQAAAAAYEAIDRAPTDIARRGAETWLNELIWREFYIAHLHHFPQVRGQSFRAQYDRIAWRQADDEFAAWCEGRTGYPLVDAAMRQLTTTGWMHNRARMIAASFLVKDLLIDWRRGEQFFMQHLVDGDVASNNGGWQWSAGTGTDAAPYFRIFNPTTQAKKFDPAGEYIRRWLPELSAVPDKYIHEPQKMPGDVQREAGSIIDRDYPAPIVDHRLARERTLAAFGAVRA